MELDQGEIYRRASSYVATGVPAEQALDQAYADAIADREEIRMNHAIRGAEDDAWQQLAAEVGVVAANRRRAQAESRRTQESQRVERARLGLPPLEEPEELNKELCPRCGDLLWTSEGPTGHKGITVQTPFGSVQWGGRDPRQNAIPWVRCSNADCSYPSPEQTSSGVYSPQRRYFR